jgi:hypothetical protein
MANKKIIGITYTKDPFSAKVGMDIIRWFSLSRALAKRNYEVDMITVDGKDEKEIGRNLRIVPIKNARWQDYVAVKSCYQKTINFIPEHRLIISRLARVVDPDETARDKKDAEDLFRWQNMTYENANIILVNDEINRQRLLGIYKRKKDVFLLPTGCPSDFEISPTSPFKKDKPIAVFLGSISNEKIIESLNQIGFFLKKSGWILLVGGVNKTKYYCDEEKELDKRYCSYVGPLTYEESLSYMHYADVGLSVAPGPHIFENEISKIYYYLRVGLPTVSEERIPNNDLIETTKFGRIFPYSDYRRAAKLVLKVGSSNRKRDLSDSVIKYMLENHSWDVRAKYLDELITGYRKNNSTV